MQIIVLKSIIELVKGILHSFAALVKRCWDLDEPLVLLGSPDSAASVGIRMIASGNGDVCLTESGGILRKILT